MTPLAGREGRKRSVALLLAWTILFQSLVGLFLTEKVQAAETRETIRIPDSTYYNVTPGYTGGGLFNIPGPGTINDLVGNTQGDNYLLFTQNVADQSIVNTNITFPIFEKDLEFQLDMNFGNTYGGINYHNRGMAIVLHPNGVGQLPGNEGNGDYSRLGVYGAKNDYNHITDALAVEFDVLGQADWLIDGDAYLYEGNGSVSGPHVAITQPISPTNQSRVIHNATSSYSSLNNGQYHRVIVRWKNTGVDQYTFSYEVFADSSPDPGEAPAVSGSMSYTTDQALELFGYSTDLRLSVTAGGGYIHYENTNMSIRFPSLYDYRVNYYLQNPDGSTTTTPVPGIITNYVGGSTGTPSLYETGGMANPVYGRATQGNIQVPIPSAPTGYQLVTGQSSQRFVSSSPSQNVFNIYYKPLSVPYKVSYYYEDMDQPAGTNAYIFQATRTFEDFVGHTVSAPKAEGTFPEGMAELKYILDDQLRQGAITQQQYDMYLNGSLYVSPSSTDPVKSNPTGVVTPDDPATPQDESLELKLYFKGRRDIPYAVDYYLLNSSTTTVAERMTTDSTGAPLQGGIDTTVDISQVSGLVKTIPGYTLVTTDMNLYLGSATSNVKRLEYTANTNVPYTVEHYKVPKGTTDLSTLTPTDTENFTGTTGTVVRGTPKTYLGYALDATHTGSGGTATLAGDGSTVLKLYYSPVDTYYVVEHYITGQTSPFLRQGIPAKTDDQVTTSPINREGYAYNATTSTASGTVIGVENPGVDPETFPADQWTGLTLKLYYDPKTDIPVTVRHLKADGTSYAPDTVLQNQTMDTEISLNAVSHPGYDVAPPQGYTLTGEAITYKVKATGNTVTFTYTPRTDTSYAVEYYRVGETTPVGTLTYTGTTDTTATAVDILTDFSDTSLAAESIRNDLDGYKLDIAEAGSVPSASIKGDGTTVLKLYYEAGMEEYTIQYFLQNADGSYPSTPSRSLIAVGIVDSTVTFDSTAEVHKIPGYTYDGSVAGTVTSTTVTTGTEDILKVYYTANTSTPYTIQYYVQDGRGSTNYVLNTQDTTQTATTGSTTPTTTDHTVLGYTLNAAKTETTSATIAGDGSTVVKFYYDLKESEYTIYYYVQGAFRVYSTTPSAKVTVSAMIGDEITPPALTDPSLETISGWDYTQYKGFMLDEGWTETLPVTIVSDTQTINVYYKPIEQRPYKVQHYIWDLTLGQEIMKEEKVYTDGISSASIHVNQKNLTPDQSTGYTWNPNKTTSYFGTEIYTAAGVTPISYPNVVASDPRSLVIKLYYDPNEDTGYVVHHHLPDSEGNYTPLRITEQYYGTSSSIVTAYPLTAAEDARFAGYVFDKTYVDNKLSARLSGDGTTELDLFYKARTDTAYIVEYFLQNPDGTYSPRASQSENKTGTTGTTVYASADGTPGGTPKPITGYTFDGAHGGNLLQGTVAGDGSLRLKVYYGANKDVSYTIEYYLRTPEGYVKDESKTETITGQTTGASITAPIVDIPGYIYNADMSSSSGIVAGDSSMVLKLYYDASTSTTYRVEYYLQNADGTYPSTYSTQDSYTGTTGTMIMETPKIFPGYEYDSTHPDTVISAIIQGDGKTALKLYYTAKDAEYNVHYVTQNQDGSLTTIADSKMVTGVKVGQMITGEVPVTVPGYVSPEPEEFAVSAETNDFYYIYTVDATQTFAYRINYYRLVPQTADDTYVSVPVPNTTATTGSAAVGSVIPILPPTVEGYKLATNQPTELVIQNINANPDESSWTLDQKKSNEPTANVVNVFYIVNMDQKFDYSIRYYLQGTTNPVPGLAPNPVTGKAYAEEAIVVNKPVVAGYKPVDSTAQTLIIDSINTANNTLTVEYMRDEAQYANYTVKHVALDGPQSTVDSGNGPGVLAVETVNALIGSTVYGMPQSVTDYTYTTADSTISGIVLGDDPATTDVVESLVLTLNYVHTRNLSYTVKYVDGAGKDIAAPQVRTDAAWTVGDTVTETAAPTIPGYTLQETLPKSLVLTNESNEMTIAYSAKAVGYTVNYYLMGVDGDGNYTVQTTEAVPGTAPVVNTTATYASIITAKAPAIQGYTVEGDNSITLTIGETASDNVINFYYAPASTTAYTVEHYKQNSDGTYPEAAFEEEYRTGTTGETVTATAKTYPGYTYDGTVTGTVASGVVTADGKLVLKLYYAVNTDTPYEVHHREQGTEKVLAPTAQKTGTTGATVEENALSIPGYTPVETPKNILVGTDTSVTFYYTPRTDISYTVRYLESGTNTAVSTEKTVANRTFGETVSESAVDITGYRYVGDPAQPQTLTLKVDNNIITFYYVKDDAQVLPYTVEYFKDNVSMGGATANAVQVLDPVVTLSEIDVSNMPVGYKVDRYEFGTTETTTAVTDNVTITETMNILKVYYTEDTTQTFSYTVNYYKDGGTLLGTKTAGVPKANPQVTVDSTVDVDGTATAIQEALKPTGYKLDTARSTLLPQTVSENNNVINVYYEVDESSTLTYTVEYYKTGEETAFKSVSNQTVTVANPQVTEGKIAELLGGDMPTGYALDHYEFGGSTAPAPFTITEVNNLIKVYYAPDATQTLPYTVNYYKDGVLLDYEQKSVPLSSPQVTGVTDKMPVGYKLDEAASTALPKTVTATDNVLYVYYVKDDTKTLSYTVEYWKDGETSAFATESGSVYQYDPTLQGVDTATHMPSGYRVKSTDPMSFPVTITEGQILKVVYEVDDQSKLPYTVEYYKDGAFMSYNPNNSVLVSDPTVKAIDTTNLPTGYKVESYEFGGISGGDVPAEGYTITETNKILKVYYVLDTTQTLLYTVNYYRGEETTPFATESLTVPEGDPEVDNVDVTNMPTGYRLDHYEFGGGTASAPFTVTEANHVIDVYYVVDNAQSLSYTLEHYTVFDGKETLYQVGTGTVTKANPEVTLSPITITGYAYDETLTGTLPTEITANGQIIKMKYSVDSNQTFAYSVNYYILGTTTPVPGIDQTEGTGNGTPSGTDTLGATVDILQPTLTTGYKVAANQPTQLTVKSDGTSSTTVYYQLDESQVYTYKIRYTRDNTVVMEELTVTVPKANPQVTASTVVAGSGITLHEYRKPEGYMVNTSNLYTTPLPRTLSDDTTLIRVDYIMDPDQHYSYKVEHYAGDSGVPAFTETKNVLMSDPVVRTVEDRSATVLSLRGYQLDHTVPAIPATLSADDQVIKAYYIVDTEESYTYYIRYYRDDEATAFETVAKTVPMGAPTVTLADIDQTNRPEGYGFEQYGYGSTRPYTNPTITFSSTSNKTIDVFYRSVSGGATLNPVGSGMTEVTGTAPANSSVTITFPGDADPNTDGIQPITTTVTAGPEGNYSATVPAGVAMTEGDTVAAVAVEAGKLPGVPAEQIVFTDSDGDGLSDQDETSKYRTNPNAKDTDKDGLMDNEEIFETKSNPTRKDSDGDALSDFDEVREYHTNPMRRDSDGDGRSDYDEIQAGTNPNVRD